MMSMSICVYIHCCANSIHDEHKILNELPRTYIRASIESSEDAHDNISQKKTYVRFLHRKNILLIISCSTRNRNLKSEHHLWDFKIMLLGYSTLWSKWILPYILGSFGVKLGSYAHIGCCESVYPCCESVYLRICAPKLRICVPTANLCPKAANLCTILVLLRICVPTPRQTVDFL